MDDYIKRSDAIKAFDTMGRVPHEIIVDILNHVKKADICEYKSSMRLIDADALSKMLADDFTSKGHFAKYVIDAAPTIDAVEVVRCKDCAWCKTELCQMALFTSVNVNGVVLEWHHNDTDFCSFGERKTEE